MTAASPTYWRTLHGTHRHTEFHCANKHRSIYSGDCLVVTPAEFESLEPCAECCTLEEQNAWRAKLAKAEKIMCPNSGIAHPGRGRIYDECKDCGKTGKVNRTTGRIKAHQAQAPQLAIDERVEIAAGDERGGWGIVRKVVSSEEIHVAVYGGETRVYERRELRRNATR
jgi:hypothetical protein